MSPLCPKSFIGDASGSATMKTVQIAPENKNLVAP